MPSYNGQNATLNQLIATFQLIAEKHSMLNSFFQGHPFEITEKTVLNYPLLVTDILPVQFDVQTIQYNFRVFVMDLVNTDDRSNELEVKSDSLRTIWDIINMLGSGNVFDLVVSTSDVTPFDEQLIDRVAGFRIDIGILTPQTSDYCDVPFKN